ncbi:MAG: methyltransferase domain-containing protein [Deltaproteobacteria bacterium]|nr:methyltransferase domain-containing protein [Deltaproteobacteria bacterium]
MPLTAEDIRQKYDAAAKWYDRAEAIPEWLGLWRLRREMISRVKGRVLEVAAGTGKNFRFYPPNTPLTACDLSPVMLDVAQQRAQRLGLEVSLQVMDAEKLDYPSGHFDTVVTSLSLCTFPHPVAALREMSRVCRAGGHLLLLEHGRSDREWLGRWQDRRAEAHAKPFGCQWNRRPLELLAQAGLECVQQRRVFFGIFHLMTVRGTGGAG